MIRAILHEPGITAAELRKKLGLSQSTVAGILERLAHKGLLEKTLVDGDARKMSLRPTLPAGWSWKPCSGRRRWKRRSGVMEGMTPDEQKEFDRLLEIALAHMTAVREQGE